MVTTDREKLFGFAKVYYSKLFVNYDDPTKALDIWFEHLRDLYQQGAVDRAKSVAGESRTATELDSKLDILIQREQFKPLVLASAKEDFKKEEN